MTQLVPLHLTLPPPFALRVAGLTTQTLAPLASPELQRVARQVSEARLQLDLVQMRATGALHHLIGQTESPQERRDLLRVKRQLTRQTALTAPLDLPAVIPLLGPYQQALGAYHEALNHAEQTLAAELARCSAALRDLWQASPDLQSALLLSSPTLYADAFRWWTGQPLAPKSLRHVQDALLNYLLRSVTKPSPFGRYTSVTTGRWTLDAGAAPLSTCGQWAPVVRAELNLSVTAALDGSIGRASSPQPDVLVALNPSLRVEDGQTCQFLTVMGRVVRTPHTAALQQLLAALHTPQTFGQLCQQLGHADPMPFWRQIQRLQAAGLLSCTVQQHSPLLEPLGALLALFSQLEPAARQGALHQLRERTVQTYDHLALDRLGWTPPVRNLVFEDSAAPDLAPQASLPAWQAALQDLQLVQRAFTLADQTLPMRLAFSDWMGHRYGYGTPVPVMQVYEDQVRTGGPHLVTSTAFRWPGPEPFAFQTLGHQVQSALAGTETGTVCAQHLRQLLSDLTDAHTAPSLGFYSQMAPHPLGIGVVLNAVQLGFGRSVGRARHIGGVPPEEVRHGRPVVELTAALPANINQHCTPATAQVALPGVAPRPGQVPLRELYLLVERPGGRPDLWCPHLGLVWGVPLGLLGEAWHSPITRFLTGMTVGGPIDPGLPPLRPPQPGRLHWPRLQLGRVTLQRERWVLDAPQTAAFCGVADLASLLRRENLCAQWGVPRHVFIRPLGRSAKPQFMDLDSPVSALILAQFSRGVEPGSGLILEEAWPDPLDHASPGQVASTNGQHVTEWVIEPGYA